MKTFPTVSISIKIVTLGVIELISPLNRGAKVIYVGYSNADISGH